MQFLDNIEIIRPGEYYDETVYKGRAEVVPEDYGVSAIVKGWCYLPDVAHLDNDCVPVMRNRDHVVWHDNDLERKGEVGKYDRDVNAFEFSFVDARQCLDDVSVRTKSDVSAGGGAVTKTWSEAEAVEAQLTDISFRRFYGRDMVFAANTFRVIWHKDTVTSLTDEDKLFDSSSREYRIQEINHGQDSLDLWYDLICVRVQ